MTHNFDQQDETRQFRISSTIKIFAWWSFDHLSKQLLMNFEAAHFEKNENEVWQR